MVNKRLLKKTGEFLQHCLSDPNYSSDELQFNKLQMDLPDATLTQFRDKVTSIDNPVIIDMCGLFGQRFGLWVAHNNKSSNVHIYDCEKKAAKFNNLLFSEDKHEDAFNLSEFNALQANDIEYKVNENYMLNGLHNAKFHHKEITPEKLDKIINRYQSRKVILFGERLDHLVETITHAANKHKADMIIAPFIQQEESESYKDDPIIRLIRKHIDIRKEKNNSKIIDPSSTPESRAYTAMQQYYALKAASSLGAKVYRESKLTRNFPFNKPTHYVSTIEI